MVLRAPSDLMVLLLWLIRGQPIQLNTINRQYYQRNDGLLRCSREPIGVSNGLVLLVYRLHGVHDGFHPKYPWKPDYDYEHL